MTKSLAQLQKQIDRLQSQAQAIKKKEVSGVIERIKAAIATYGLTAQDLGLARSASPRAEAPRKAGRKTAKSTRAARIKYRDDAGHAWTGHGRRPQWFIDAIASGKTPEQLAA